MKRKEGVPRDSGSDMIKERPQRKLGAFERYESDFQVQKYEKNLQESKRWVIITLLVTILVCYYVKGKVLLKLELQLTQFD